MKVVIVSYNSAMKVDFEHTSRDPMTITGIAICRF